MSHSYLMTLLLSLSLWVPGAVAAQPAEISPTEKAKVEAFSKQGVHAYRAAKYGEAIGYFRRAYTIFPEPKLLFNLGRCHQMRGEFDEAIDHFAQVVGDHSAQPALRERAQTELDVLVAARQMASANAKKASLGLSTPAAAPQAVPVPRVRVTRIEAVTSVSPGSTTNGGNRGTIWTLVSIGAATLVAGSIFYSLGLTDHGELEDAKGAASISLTRAEAIALRDGGANRKTAGVTLLSISGAALLTGTALFLLADDAEAREGVQVGPVGDGFGAGWGGRF